MPLLLLSVVYDYGCAVACVVVNLLNLAVRCVYTAVRAVALVNISAEGGTPACVMDTAAAVEAHPVVYEGRVSGTVEVCISGA